MESGRTTRRDGAGAGSLVLGLLLVLLAVPAPAEAQYFGRNKVQYDDFEWRVLPTDHFDVHYYEEEEEATTDLARMSERWYERFARTFQHEFEQKKPLIIYADHPDFQQTNTLRGAIGESTGGVTESLKNRVIMPLGGSYADTDHVLGHELVHAFQYNIAQSRRGGGLQGLGALPLWLIEGMAEYLSVGREDPLTAMWLRDAIRRDDYPSIKDMTEEQRFFPYRFGQALWAYIGGEYGDDAVIQIFRRSLRVGFQPAIQQVLGMSTDTLSARWRRRVEQVYVPLMAGRTAPEAIGTALITPENAGEMNISPSISPDGRYVAFLSQKDLFTIDMFLADAQTGEIIRKLASANSDPHVDALSYTEASGTWSPDSRYFAYVTFAQGDNELVIVEVDGGDVYQQIHPAGISALNNPAWSPDGSQIVFTGITGGISDLYTYDLEAQAVRRLTNDKHADFHPAWSPDGRTVAFASDRGPTTDFQTLVYSNFQISLLDVPTGRIETLSLFESARHSNPQYGPDGTLFFLSDQDGFSDLYALRPNGDVERITQLVTGISGITGLAPAMSVARETGTIAFSVFTGFNEFNIHTLPASATGTAAARVVEAPDIRGRRLPPATPDVFSRVSEYLDDPLTGLPPADRYTAADAVDYEPSLALDMIGQPSVGVGADRFGNYIGGGASAYFSDMLGNKNLGVAVQAQGTFKDIGGQVMYQDLGDRWNWGVAAGRIPYLMVYSRWAQTPEDEVYLGQLRQRIYITAANGTVAYPFSTTRRIEFSGGATRYSFDVEEDRFYYDPNTGRFYEQERVQLDEAEPDPMNMVEASAAYVGDNSFFGFTSPVRGGRFRFELQGTTGTEDYLTAIADWRRYLQPHENLTVAFRGMHYGRYLGVEQESLFLRELFLGYETFVRGYAYESFDANECRARDAAGPIGNTACPTFDRLFGHRIAVANFELRVPLLGVEQFGVFNFPYLPTELVGFVDAGLAWDEDDSPVLEFSRSSTARVPVFSTGVSARFNVLGFLVFEAYYAYPFQRPEKGGHWGFQLAPGW